MKKFLGILAALFIISGGCLSAQNFNDSTFDEPERKIPSENPLMHYAGLEFGSTTIFNHYTSMHIGACYEMKKLYGKHGIGFFFDYMLGPGTEIWFGFPITIHDPFKVKNLVLSAAPGIGITQSLNYKIGESPSVGEEDKMLPDETRRNLLLKGSVSYVFPVLNDSNREFMRIEPYLDVFFIANYNTYVSLGTKIKFDIYGK